MPHYFQRYTQRENFVTNATLLLLSRLNYFNRNYFEGAVNAILGDQAAISTEIGFDQQKGGTGNKNIIDGLITQSSFAIAIETKLYDNQRAAQLVRHFDSLRGHADTKVLLALSEHPPSDALLRKVRAVAAEQRPDDNIKVTSTTYDEIISAVQLQLSDRDIEFADILDDYRALCEELNLLNVAKKTMLAVAVKDSLVLNTKHRLYYHPATRNLNRSFEYLAFYQDNHIRAVGRVGVVVAADYVDGLLEFPEGRPAALTVEHEERIKSCITETSYYSLTRGVRFFLLEDFIGDLAIRTAKRIQSKKYFQFEEEIDLLALDAKTVLATRIKGSYD